jgi:hypothetical protein
MPKIGPKSHFLKKIQYPVGITGGSRLLIINNRGPRSQFPVLANNREPAPGLHPYQRLPLNWRKTIEMGQLKVRQNAFFGRSCIECRDHLFIECSSSRRLCEEVLLRCQPGMRLLVKV